MPHLLGLVHLVREESGTGTSLQTRDSLGPSGRAYRGISRRNPAARDHSSLPILPLLIYCVRLHHYSRSLSRLLDCVSTTSGRRPISDTQIYFHLSFSLCSCLCAVCYSPPLLLPVKTCPYRAALDSKKVKPDPTRRSASSPGSRGTGFTFLLSNREPFRLVSRPDLSNLARKPSNLN